jgi:hypothetical protein
MNDKNDRKWLCVAMPRPVESEVEIIAEGKGRFG